METFAVLWWFFVSMMLSVYATELRYKTAHLDRECDELARTCAARAKTDDKDHGMEPFTDHWYPDWWRKRARKAVANDKR